MLKNLNAPALGVSGHQSEIIELAMTFGFQGLDFNVAEFATQARLKGLDYAMRLVRSANRSAKLKLGTFALPLAWEDEDDQYGKELAKLSEYARAAADAGCTCCTTTVSPVNDKRPYHENFEFHRKRLAEIAGQLAPAGVRLAVGFHAGEYLRKNSAQFQFIHDLDALTLLVNMVGASNVGLLLDTWDLAVCGATVDAVRKLPAQQIVAVQVAEAPAEVAAADIAENSRLLPGDERGQGRSAAILAVLKEMGYDGPVTPRPSRSAFNTRKRDLIVKQAGEAMDKLWRAAGLPIEPKRTVTPSRDDGFSLPPRTYERA